MTSMRRSRIFVGLAALLLAVGGTVAAPGAVAAPSPADGKTGQAQAAEQHCTVYVPTGATQCFGTFHEAIAHATAGRVTDANLDATTLRADSKTAAQLNSADATAPQVVIGIEYFLQNYTAPTLTFSGPVACTTTLANIDYRAVPLPTVGGINWNNDIRSFDAFSNCWQRLWDNGEGEPCGGALLINYTFTWNGLPAPHPAWDRAECIDWS